MRLIGEAILAIVVALMLPSICLWLSGSSLAAWGVLFFAAFGSYDAFLETLVYAIPLCVIGSGLAVAFRGGVFNIGGDGQLIAGSIAAVALAPWLAALGFSGLLLFLLTGFVGGGAVGALVGWLRARFNANEIIVTIMLNYVAIQALAWVVRGPLQESMRFVPRSFPIGAALQLPYLMVGSRLHAGIWIALAAPLIAAALMRTSFGFKLAVLGDNPNAARYAGFPSQRLVVGAMLFSGACAGLAGAVEISALHHRLQDGFAEGYGVVGIAVALMARLSPLLVPFTAIVFAAFLAGSGALQRQLNVPFPIAWVIEGSVILAFIALRSIRRVQWTG